MKKLIRVIFKFAVGFAGIALVFGGCTEEINDLSKGLLPISDLVSIRKDSSATEANIKAFTVTDELQRTDEPKFNLLGTFNDPVFGKTTVDFATQLRLLSFPEFKPNDIFDSLVYYVAYEEIYGDTLTPQNIKLYELASDLSFDAKYFQNADLKSFAKTEVLSAVNYIPKFRLDSLTNTYGSTKAVPRDTVTQQIAFHLNETFARKLMALDSVTLSSNDRFLQEFKGFYIEANPLANGGTIMKSTGSGMVLFFRKENDTTKYNQTFFVTKSAARVSRFAHDYSGTAFAANLNQQVIQDSLIYLQTTGGLRSKIVIPNLKIWEDSTDIAVLQAQLIFQVDSIISEPNKYLPVQKLSLAAIDSKGKPYYPLDYAFSSIYFGGSYYSSDKTYRFNITKHLQELMKTKTDAADDPWDKYGFYLETWDKNSSFRRVALKGGTSKTGIRLEVTYSKIK